MKTTMKKVLSMALALVLVLGMLPMAAYATHTGGHYDDNNNGICDASGCTVTAVTCAHEAAVPATCQSRAICKVAILALI